MTIAGLLIFLVGVQLGLIIGAFACVRYVRQEMTAKLTPAVELLDLRVANLNSRVLLALEERVTRGDRTSP